MTAADHNDVLYKVASDMGSTHLVLVSVFVPCFAEVIEQVGPGYLASRYGELLRPTAECGFSLSLLLDLDALAAATEARRAEVITLASCVRRDIEGAALWVCFGALLHRTPVARPLFVAHVRPGEPMFVVPAADRVVVIFALAFTDPTELALASIFLQVRPAPVRSGPCRPPCRRAVGAWVRESCERTRGLARPWLARTAPRARALILAPSPARLARPTLTTARAPTF